MSEFTTLAEIRPIDIAKDGETTTTPAIVIGVWAAHLGQTLVRHLSGQEPYWTLTYMGGGRYHGMGAQPVCEPMGMDWLDAVMMCRELDDIGTPDGEDPVWLAKVRIIFDAKAAQMEAQREDPEVDE